MARGSADGSVDACTNITILHTHNLDKAPGGIGGRGMREVEACGCGAGVGAGARGRGGGRREREEHCSSSAGRVMLAEFGCMEFFFGGGRQSGRIRRRKWYRNTM